MLTCYKCHTDLSSRAYNRCKDCNNTLCDNCYSTHRHKTQDSVVKQINDTLVNPRLTDKQKLAVIMGLVEQ